MSVSDRAPDDDDDIRFEAMGDLSKASNRLLVGDLRLSSPPSGQGAGGGARIRDRRVNAYLRADSLVTVPLCILWVIYPFSSHKEENAYDKKNHNDQQSYYMLYDLQRSID
ncbi:hypothetical protein PoB_002993200 [Plakobranchus ocellatus]|uniref:Uncharacterized protein n=1 Tax=Plakobranchus ocellatus TaxID=259542 RepID=A0AAV4A839_9GAST|nr:hypothetical protein PoB_002993200 [Plakobranchus ocellatus]